MQGNKGGSAVNTQNCTVVTGTGAVAAKVRLVALILILLLSGAHSEREDTTGATMFVVFSEAHERGESSTYSNSGLIFRLDSALFFDSQTTVYRKRELILGSMSTVCRMSRIDTFPSVPKGTGLPFSTDSITLANGRLTINYATNERHFQKLCMTE